VAVFESGGICPPPRSVSRVPHCGDRGAEQARGNRIAAVPTVHGAGLRAAAFVKSVIWINAARAGAAQYAMRQNL